MRSGPDRLVARLKNAGVAPLLPKDAAPGLAVGLGGAGVRLTDLGDTLYRAGARRRGPAAHLACRRTEPRPQPPRRLFDKAAAWQVGDVLIGAPAPQNALAGKIAFKTGTSYGYRDAWAVGFDGANTVAVWVGRPDNEPVPGLVGRTAAAPILFDAFTAHRREARALAAAAARRRLCAHIGTACRLAALPSARPAGDRRIRAWRSAARHRLSARRRQDRSVGRRSDVGLALKAMGGAPPFTWFADGMPIVIGETRRETAWEKPGKGSARFRSSTRADAPRACRCGWILKYAIVGSHPIYIPARNSGVVAGDALEAEALEIDGAIGAMDDELGDGIAGARSLLQAMAGKAIGEQEIRKLPDAGR